MGDRQLMKRRAFLAAALAAVPSTYVVRAQGVRARGSRAHVLTASDDAFLEDVSRRSFRYFWEHGDPRTGLVRDRARADGSPHVPAQRDVASIAATGFGLVALAIARERRWGSGPEITERVRRTLAFVAHEMPQEHGWYFHFVRAQTGEREWQCELSSIDTALLVAGVLTVRQAFAGEREIVADATRIYERIDFPWMLAGDPLLLSMGWKPESGFLESRWQHYCELMILYLLGLGSPTKALARASWLAWTRPRLEYANFRIVSHGDPLFVHQYSHAFVDFRGRRERATGIDWWQNSVDATRMHKAFCLSLAREFPGYEDNVWGITASDSAKGYVAWGGPPHDSAIDGTVVPCASGGSLMFTPVLCVPVLRTLASRWGDRVYGRYGFVDAFNPITSWINPDVLGIDQGITLLSAENLRTGRVWRWLMANREIAHALDLAGVVSVA